MNNDYNNQQAQKIPQPQQAQEVQQPQQAQEPQQPLYPQQQPQYQPQYQQPYISPAPVGQLKTNKTLRKFILLNLITFGIYSLVVMSSVSESINIVASRYDGRKTMHFCLLFFVIAPITLGIGAIVWYHRISARMGSELRRRGIQFSFSAADYWLWNVLGCLIIVGPFVYLYKMFRACNLLCANYNAIG